MNHDQLQAQCFQWAHNTFPQIRGHLFACLNELKPIPGESKQSHLKRISHAKSIGLRKGVLDLMLIVPYYGNGIVYGFDIKIRPDKFSKDQRDFVEILRKCGGDGWEIEDFAQFQSIFTSLILKHYGTINPDATKIL